MANRKSERQGKQHSFATAFAQFAPGDVVPDSDERYIKRPEIFNLPDGSKKVTGVSFFTPIDIFKLRTLADRSCSVPDNIEILQNTFWRVAAEEAATDKYPEYFQSMSVKDREDRVVHGLHYAIFPKDRMLLDDFKASVAKVHDTSIGIGCNCEGEGGDSEAKATDSAGSPFKTAMPACSYMRLVCEALHAFCEALHAFCEADSTEPTDAMFAYLLLHDIGAADSDITRLLYDTSEARLAYRAVKVFKDPGTIGINVGGDIYDMCKLLETVLPRFLHQKNPLSESDDEDEVRGGRGVVMPS